MQDSGGVPAAVSGHGLAPGFDPAPAHGRAEPRPSHSIFSRIRAVAADIKLAHSIFALPFAVLGAFLAWRGPMSWGLAERLGLVVVCMVCARTWAMLVNRLADARFDAANPRTARRAIPSGRLSRRDALAAAAIGGAAFVAATACFWLFHGNAWPLILSVPVLAWIAFYSFTKRFTALCHVFLGGALAASPLAAAIAVNPASLSGVPALWFMAAMVVCWVAGFDIIYALQDIDVDRAAGLRSVPSRLGARGALWVSRALHAGALAMLVLAWRAEPRLGPMFVAGVAAVAGLLAWEHAILIRRGKAGLDMAFFTINGIVSCVLGAAGCVDVVV